LISPASKSKKKPELGFSANFFKEKQKYKNIHTFFHIHGKN